MSALDNIKKYKKNIIIGTLLVILMPIMGVLMKIIFTYGNYIGTLIRSISENGVCF